MAAAVGEDLAGKFRDISIALYTAGAERAAERGISLADTKFEFDLLDGEIVLADEVLTPKSSRYSPADIWRSGTSPPSFDKQFVRDYVDSVGWDHHPPAPQLSEEVVMITRVKYVNAYELPTERRFDD